MTEEGLLRLFVFLLWLGNVSYLVGALWVSRPSVYKTRLAQKPLARAAQSALRKIVVANMLCVSVATGAYMWVSRYTLPEILSAPTPVTLSGVGLYILIYTMAILPGTLLWGHVNSLRIIDEARFERMIEVQQAAKEGRPVDYSRWSHSNRGG